MLNKLKKETLSDINELIGNVDLGFIVSLSKNRGQLKTVCIKNRHIQCVNVGYKVTYNNAIFDINKYTNSIEVK